MNIFANKGWNVVKGRFIPQSETGNPKSENQPESKKRVAKEVRVSSGGVVSSGRIAVVFIARFPIEFQVKESVPA